MLTYVMLWMLIGMGVSVGMCYIDWQYLEGNYEEVTVSMLLTLLFLSVFWPITLVLFLFNFLIITTHVANK